MVEQRAHVNLGVNVEVEVEVRDWVGGDCAGALELLEWDAIIVEEEED